MPVAIFSSQNLKGKPMSKRSMISRNRNEGILKGNCMSLVNFCCKVYILFTFLYAAIEECGEGLDNCDRVNGDCIDTDAGFVCVCNNGYRGDGVTCGKHVSCRFMANCIIPVHSTWPLIKHSLYVGILGTRLILCDSTGGYYCCNHLSRVWIQFRMWLHQCRK